MERPFLYYKELLQPTNVSNSLFIKPSTFDESSNTFLPFSGQDILITTSSRGLNIYHCIENKNNNEGYSLIQVYSIDLNGKPQCLNKITKVNPMKQNIMEDYILISFDCGKLVVFSFDNDSYELIPIEYYNAEEDALGLGADIKSNGLKKSKNINQLKSSDNNNLACMSIYGSDLFFIDLSDSKNNFIYYNTKEFGAKIIDFTFVSSCIQPTIAILYERNTLPIGHIKDVRNNCAIYVYSVDMGSKKLIKLWSKDNLPHDSLQLFPLKHVAFQGGFLLISMNAVLLINKDYTTGIGINSFADVSVTDNIKLQENVFALNNEPVELNGSNWLEISDVLYIASLKNGMMIQLYLDVSNSSHWSQTKILFTSINKSIFYTTLSKNYNNTKVFFGSLQSSGMLLSMDYLLNNKINIKNEDDNSDEKVVKKLKKNEDDITIENNFLYTNNNLSTITTTDTLSSSSSLLLSFNTDLLSFEVLDFLPAIGPIFDATFVGGNRGVSNKSSELVWDKLSSTSVSNVPSSAAAFIHDSEAKDVLMLSAGSQNDSAIYNISQGLRIAKIAVRPFPTVLTIHTLTKTSLFYNCIILNCSDKIRILKSYQEDSKFQLDETQPEELNLINSPTLGIHEFPNDQSILLQITHTNIRLVKLNTEKSTKILSEINIESDINEISETNILAYDAVDENLVIHCSSGNCHAFQINKNKIEHVMKIGNGKDLEEVSTTKSKSKASKSKSNDQVKQIAVPFDSLAISSISWYYGVLPVDNENETKSNSLNYNDEIAESFYLYGNNKSEEIVAEVIETTKSKSKSKKATAKKTKEIVDTKKEVKEEVIHKPNLYLIVSSLLGDIIVYDTTTAEIVFNCDVSDMKNSIKIHSSYEPSLLPSSERKIKDVRIFRLNEAAIDNKYSRLCLSIITDRGELISYYGNDHTASKLTTFTRFSHVTLIKRKVKNQKSGRFTTEINNNTTFVYKNHYFSRIINLDGKDGMRINGSYPCMILSERGLPLVIPFAFPEIPYGNAGEYCICDLNTSDANCYASLWREDISSDVPGRTAVLGIYQETGISNFINNDICMQRIATGTTVHSCKDILPLSDDKIELSMLAKQRTCLMITSKIKKSDFLSKVLSDEALKFDKANYDRFHNDMESFYQPLDKSKLNTPSTTERKYSINFSYGDHVVDTLELNDGEHVMDSDILYFTLEDPGNAMKTIKRVFIIVATAISDKHGEDSQGEGRLLLYAIDYTQLSAIQKVVDESAGNDDGNDDNKVAIDATSTTPSKESSSGGDQFLDLIRPKLRQIWAGPGPASIVKQFGNYVVSTVGASLYIYKMLENMELEQISFFHAKFYISSVSIIKDFILIGDAYCSVQFLCWRESDNSLTLLGCDYDRCYSQSTSFIVDENSLGMLLADNEENIRCLQYNPISMESKQGYRLLGLSDFHLGSTPNIQVTHRLLASSNQKSGRERFERLQRYHKSNSKRTSTLVGCMDGSIGMFIPIDEKVYRRLVLLQQIMSTVIPARFGLNPREFRKIKTMHPTPPSKHSVLDGKLLSQFFMLDYSIQVDITAAMGTTIDLIIDNLQEINSGVAAYF